MPAPGARHAEKEALSEHAVIVSSVELLQTGT